MKKSYKKRVDITLDPDIIKKTLKFIKKTKPTFKNFSHTVEVALVKLMNPNNKGDLP